MQELDAEIGNLPIKNPKQRGISCISEDDAARCGGVREKRRG